MFSRALLTSWCARRVGSGRRYFVVQASTILIASFSVHLLPTEIKRGLTLVRVRRTAPIVSLSSLRGLRPPFSSGGSSKVPMSRLLAQPMVGLSKNSPKWAAMPSRRGWATPWPSIRKASGVFCSFSTAAIQAGASRNESRPGMYGKVSFLTAVFVSTISKPGRLRTTAAAMMRLPSFVKAQSRPVTSVGRFFIGV